MGWTKLYYTRSGAQRYELFSLVGIVVVKTLFGKSWLVLSAATVKIGSFMCGGCGVGRPLTASLVPHCGYSYFNIRCCLNRSHTSKKTECQQQGVESGHGWSRDPQWWNTGRIIQKVTCVCQLKILLRALFAPIHVRSL